MPFAEGQQATNLIFVRLVTHLIISAVVLFLAVSISLEDLQRRPLGIKQIQRIRWLRGSVGRCHWRGKGRGFAHGHKKIIALPTFFCSFFGETVPSRLGKSAITSGSHQATNRSSQLFVVSKCSGFAEAVVQFKTPGGENVTWPPVVLIVGYANGFGPQRNKGWVPWLDWSSKRTCHTFLGQCAIWYSHAASRTDFWEWISRIYDLCCFFRGRVHDVFFVCQNKAETDETLWVLKHIMSWSCFTFLKEFVSLLFWLQVTHHHIFWFSLQQQEVKGTKNFFPVLYQAIAIFEIEESYDMLWSHWSFSFQQRVGTKPIKSQNQILLRNPIIPVLFLKNWFQVIIIQIWVVGIMFRYHPGTSFCFRNSQYFWSIPSQKKTPIACCLRRLVWPWITLR